MIDPIKLSINAPQLATDMNAGSTIAAPDAFGYVTPLGPTSSSILTSI